MKYTVGIITYERPQYVERLLKSILDGEELPDEIVIVDDSESEETEERVQGLDFPEVISLNYIHREGKTIQGEARNLLIEEAEGDVICFLDDDTEVTETWLKALKQTYGEDEEVAGVGGPAVVTDDEKEPRYEIIREKENQNHFNKYGESQDMSGRWIPPEPVETDRFIGANMSFRKEKLEEYGGFSTDYQGNGYREEDSFMVKLWKNDEKLIYHPEAKVYHFTAPEGGSRASKDAIYWKGRNLIRFTKENFPENYHKALIRLTFKTDHYPPPLWKDFLGMIIYRKPERIWKFKGYLDEVILG